MLATLQFPGCRRRAGRYVLRILVRRYRRGPPRAAPVDELDRPLHVLAREMVADGVSLPRNLALCAAIGAWLMLSRLILGSEETTANSHHVIGALVLTTTTMAVAKVAPSVRVLGGHPFFQSLPGRPVAAVQTAFAVAGLAVVLLSLPCGPVRHRYGGWNAHLSMHT